MAAKIWKFTVFFISFGMLYPHVFSDDAGEITVSCTKCGRSATTAI